jgi:hypothetical protein
MIVELISLLFDIDFIISNLSSFDFTPPAVLLLSEPQ